MGQRDHVGQLVEREGRHRQHLVAGERPALVEQGVLGVEEGVVHARQSTGAVLAPGTRGSAHLFAATAPPSGRPRDRLATSRPTACTAPGNGACPWRDGAPRCRLRLAYAVR